MQNNASSTIVIDYYSDVLCVWAWIAQPRLEQVHSQWGDKVKIRHRFVDIFGDSHYKIPRQWGEADAFERFNSHVVKAAAPFEEITIHPQVWSSVKPRSSMQAHLLLKAVELVAGEQACEAMALHIRRAFFNEAQDIGNMDVILRLIEDSGLDRDLVNSSIGNGSAMAALMRDYQAARENNIKGSPSYVLDGGRQILYGNVGYRVIHTNIEELLKHPGDEASWC